MEETTKVKFIKDCAYGVVVYAEGTEAVLATQVAKRLIKRKFAEEVKPKNKEK